jgi:two-component system, LytTR family, response regulator
MRVLIIDDEPLARTALANVLATRSDVEGFDSASDAVEALDKLEKNSYDVLLLDINMPEVSGIEFLDQAKENKRPMPAIIFVTAHEEHAITAFEKHAVDYVLKPFSAERIGHALDVAFRRAAGERAARLAASLPRLHRLTQKPSVRIAIKAEGRVLFIDPCDVVTVQAQGSYVLLQRGSGSYLLRESISGMADKLEPYGFIRIHRSVLVNRSFVEEIQPWVTGEYGLRLKGGKEYKVTRTYKGNLRSLAEVWIGTDTFLAE